MLLGPTLAGQNYCDSIRRHYVNCWGGAPEVLRFQKGPVNELPFGFCVLVFAPSERRKMWTYATACMSQPRDPLPMELHLLAPRRNDGLVELLVVTAHYHRTGEWLDLGHSVNFGEPWWSGSICDHGLISLPYLDGPQLEWMEFEGAKVRFLWLIPITNSEVNFKRTDGLDALEQRFEKAQFNYLNPKRPSVV